MTTIDHLSPPTAPQTTGATPGETTAPGAASAVPPTTGELAARFRPVFAAIASGAVERETDRTLAYDAVARLKAAGFTAVRVPRESGGAGATLSQALYLLRELGEADPNLVQALRAHFTTVESLLASPDPVQRERWLPRIVAGDIIGNATTEKGNAPGTNATLLRERGGRLSLDGTKYYSTGSLYADWITVHADTEAGASVRATVQRNQRGVELLDDWDGFGQRLTASGTTRFSDVEVNAHDVVPAPRADGRGFTAAYVQAVLLVALGGIARAVRRDGVEYVRGRNRAFTHGVGGDPQRDPLVQEVIGRIAGSVFAIEATLDALGLLIEDAAALQAAGSLTVGQTAELDTRVSEAQIHVVEATLDVANRLFEVGGASAASEARRLDRHWRNARVLGQHNPVIYRARAVGQQWLTGDHHTTPIYVGSAAGTGTAAPTNPSTGVVWTAGNGAKP